MGVCAGTRVYKCICLSVTLSFSKEKANSFSISHPGISLRERGWLINHHDTLFYFHDNFLFHPALSSYFSPTKSLISSPLSILQLKPMLL